MHGSYLLHLLPGVLVMPVGFGMSFPSAYAAATSGLAVISAVAASYTASLTRDSVPQALTSGYDLAMAVAAGLTLLASLVAATVIQARRNAGNPQADGQTLAGAALEPMHRP